MASHSADSASKPGMAQGPVQPWIRYVAAGIHLGTSSGGGGGAELEFQGADHIGCWQHWQAVGHKACNAVVLILWFAIAGS